MVHVSKYVIIRLPAKMDQSLVNCRCFVLQSPCWIYCFNPPFCWDKHTSHVYKYIYTVYIYTVCVCIYIYVCVCTYRYPRICPHISPYLLNYPRSSCPPHRASLSLSPGSCGISEVSSSRSWPPTGISPKIPIWWSWRLWRLEVEMHSILYMHI